MALLAAMPHGMEEELQVRRDPLCGVCNKLNLVQQRELMGLTGLGLLPEDDACFPEHARYREVGALRQIDLEALLEKLAAGPVKMPHNRP